MTDTTSIITATLMFADLHDGELHQLESAASQLTLRRGDVLFAEGADPDAKTKDGKTPLLLAAGGGHKEVVDCC